MNLETTAAAMRHSLVKSIAPLSSDMNIARPPLRPSPPTIFPVLPNRRIQRVRHCVRIQYVTSHNFLIDKLRNERAVITVNLPDVSDVLR